MGGKVEGEGELKFMKNKTIFLLATIWIWGFLLFRVVIEYFINSSRGVVSIPVDAIAGIIVWIGLVFKKKWGFSFYTYYLFIMILYSIYDLIYSSSALNITLLVIKILVGFPLLWYLSKKRVLTWED